jgi:RNA polymerase sigma-70 factor (ECF subfamily)
LAEDVCQDALFRIWQRLEECREPDRFGAWLARAVHRHALNSLRGRRPTQSLEGSEIAAGGTAPDRQVETADLVERLDRALLQLSAEQRQTVLLFDLEGWSHAEIAEALGTTEATSRQHLMQARRRLRQLLGHREKPT